MARVKRRSFYERTVIVAGRRYRAQPAYKLHTHTLFNFFELPQQDAADLSCGAHMSAAASGEIKICDVDQAKVASLLWWKLAKPKLSRFFQRYKTNGDRAV